MSDIIEATIDKLALKDLELEKPAAEDTRPPLTAALVTQVKNIIKDTGLGQGYGSVAKQVNGAKGAGYVQKVNKFQVKRIHRAMQARITALKPAQDPIV